MEVNAGEIVELAVRRKNINISELSRRMQVSRGTLYNWFQQNRLPRDVILAIGKAIDYDFSEEFQGEFCKTGQSHIGHSLLNPTRAEQDNNRELTHWMQKYISLLEEYNLFIENNPLNKVGGNNSTKKP